LATTLTTEQRRSIGSRLERKQRSLWGDALRRLLRNRAAVVGLAVIGFAAFVAVFAGVLAPYDPIAQDPPKQLMEPIWTKAFGGKYTDPAFLLGSDALGRDMLSRLMYGSRIGLIVGFVPVTIIFFIGMSVGMLAGYLGGWVDNFLMRLTDVIYAFPDLLFVIIIVAMLRSTSAGDVMGGLLVIFVGIAVVNWVGLARLVRGQVLSIKHREFVEAARAVGASPIWIMTRHIFPNILAPVIVSVDPLLHRHRDQTTDAEPRHDDRRRVCRVLDNALAGASAGSLHFCTSSRVHVRRGRAPGRSRPAFVDVIGIGRALVDSAELRRG